MSSRPYAALLMLAAASAPLHAAEPDAVAAIDACTARLDAQLDIGYERIAARCPDLARTLERSGWAAWLPQGWKESRNDLSVGSLTELRAVVTRELATPSVARTPRAERLKEILAELGATGQQRSGVWARFKNWLREVFERNEQRPDESWLERMVSRIGVSDAAIQLLTYVALGAMVGLAVFIVFNELRAAGLVGRRRTERPGEVEGEMLALRPIPTWGDVERAALSERPRLLLELIVSKLTQLSRLPPASAFTARELTRAVDLPEEADRRRLAELALTAEQARYAEGSVAPSLLESAVAHGRELLARIESREVGARARS